MNAQFRFSRRHFLKLLSTAAAGAGLSPLLGWWKTLPAHADNHVTYMPIIPNGGLGNVVQVHSAAATNWNYSSSTHYWDFVNQSTVDNMVTEGIQQVTGIPSETDAWASILPDYSSGKRIAVKVNLNNSWNESNNPIDALMQVVNSLVKSLKTYGVSENDIYVYDAVRPFPARFYGARLYNGVHYVGVSGTSENIVFSKNQASLKIQISNPQVNADVWLPDLLYNATYLINMPILKRHQSVAPVTLGFKNHFGSTNNPGGMHSYAQPGAAHYSSSYSPFVDLYTNAHIGPKTVLTIADGLFGARSVGSSPEKWQTFGNAAPNSLLFSRDPLAIECVMIDLLNAEWGVDSRVNEWLSLAENAGLGTFERGDPWHPAYQKLRFRRIDI